VIPADEPLATTRAKAGRQPDRVDQLPDAAPLGVPLQGEPLISRLVDLGGRVDRFWVGLWTTRDMRRPYVGRSAWVACSLSQGWNRCRTGAIV
jgi:hypothetical protein